MTVLVECDDNNDDKNILMEREEGVESCVVY